MRVFRLALLAVCVGLSLGSATQGTYDGSSTGPSAVGTYGAAPAAPTVTFYCHAEWSKDHQLTLCRPDAAACETERQGARDQGLGTDACQGTAQVACFQRAGLPDPSATLCAATWEDCELWRDLDRRKQGKTGAPCAWR